MIRLFLSGLEVASYDKATNECLIPTSDGCGMRAVNNLEFMHHLRGLAYVFIMNENISGSYRNFVRAYDNGLSEYIERVL